MIATPLRILTVGMLLAAFSLSPPDERPQPDAVRAVPLYTPCQPATAKGSRVASDLKDLASSAAEARRAAAARLAQTCDRQATAPLLALARDDRDPLVRVAAVEALGVIGDPAAIDPLIEMISDPDYRVRIALARTLCSFQTWRASYAVLNTLVNPLNRELTDANDMRSRGAGILAVNQLRDIIFSRKAVTFLLEFIDHPDPPTRAAADETLHELMKTKNGPSEIVGIFKQNNYPPFRIKAAMVIGRLGIERGRAALEEAAAGDRDPRVRAAASEALAKFKPAQ
jgi:HEAT repeat protein